MSAVDMTGDNVTVAMFIVKKLKFFSQFYLHFNQCSTGCGDNEGQTVN